MGSCTCSSAPPASSGAHKFVKVNWAERIDMATGRPVWTEVTKAALEGKNVQVWPSLVGGKNWHPSPVSQLLYMNTMAFGWDSTPAARRSPISKPGQPHYGVKRPLVFLYDDPNGRGYLRAIEPLTASKGPQSPNFSGTLVTAGGLVFTHSSAMAVD